MTFAGLGKDEIPMVGLSTELADYYLKNPSSAYSKIYSDLADKVKLTGVVYGILEEVMEKGKHKRSCIDKDNINYFQFLT